MLKFIEQHERKIIIAFLTFAFLKALLLGYNMLGFYDFNNAFLNY
jgi:hypothetical protein